MKQKRDYSALKLEFFKSDIDEIKVFIETKYGQWKRNWTINKNTRWWSKEKQEYKAKIVEKAIERNAEKQAKELEIPIETLLKAKKFAIWKIIEMMTKQELSMSDIAKWLEKIKTELWEPEHIGANYNMNANKKEWLSDEELQAIDLLFNSKWWTNKKQ